MWSSTIIPLGNLSGCPHGTAHPEKQGDAKMHTAQRRKENAMTQARGNRSPLRARQVETRGEDSQSCLSRTLLPVTTWSTTRNTFTTHPSGAIALGRLLLCGYTGRPSPSWSPLLGGRQTAALPDWSFLAGRRGSGRPPPWCPQVVFLPEGTCWTHGRLWRVPLREHS